MGRNIHEMVRIYDALRLHDGLGVATPANWKKGEDVLIPDQLGDEESQKLFPGYNKQSEYFKTVSLSRSH